MQHTKEQVQGRAGYIRRLYKEGKLPSKEIAQYEALPGWFWTVEPKPWHVGPIYEFTPWEKRVHDTFAKVRNAGMSREESKAHIDNLKYREAVRAETKRKEADTKEINQ